DAVGRLADQPAGLRVNGAGQVEGVGEQVVAQQDARLVAPAGVDGADVAADGGVVQNVVVHQGGGVDHLDDRPEGGVCGRDRPAGTGGQQQQGGAQALAAVVGQVGHQGRHARAAVLQGPGQDALDLFQVVRDGGEQAGLGASRGGRQ